MGAPHCPSARRLTAARERTLWRLASGALKHLPDNGVIINTSSINGLRGNKTLIDYAATKGAVLALTYSLAQVLQDRGIRVNAVAPGPVWRWVFLVNLFIGVVEIPVAVKVIPRGSEREGHDLDVVGSGLLTGVLLLVLIPLVDGGVSGWPLWSWILLATSVPAGAVLAAWEIRLARRGGEPVLQVSLLRRRSFALGQALALLYFAGFTSLFFTLSILWQQGLGRSALKTGLLVLPFAVASLGTASNSYRFSARFGRKTVQGGIAAMFAGLALMPLVLHLSAPRPGFWALVGPLFLTGLGNGLVIAPNQDFVLGSVPRIQAGTAGGDSPKTRAELYEIAKQRDLPGRSKMGRHELARKLGYK